MYKNWEGQKRNIIEVIARGECATVQIVEGTNYSIFFRNIHSDLLLKKSILPVFVDLNHLTFVNVKNVLSLTLIGFKRALNEKRLPSRVDMQLTPDSDLIHKLDEFIEEGYSRNLTPVIFFEDIDVSLGLGMELFSIFEQIRRKNIKCSFIYLSKTNLAHPDNVKKYGSAPHIYENIIYCPIKDEKYLKSIEKGISPVTFKKIYELTGGVDAFCSIAMDLKNNLAPKERRNIQRHLSDNWHLKREVHKLWDSLSHKEVKVLAHIVWGVKQFEKELDYDISHLLNLGIIERSREGYKIVIGLMKGIGVEKLQTQGLIIECSKDKFLVNGTSVSLKLSESERKVLKQFLLNKNKIVARNDLIKFMSGSAKSKNSNDAIEQAVSRIKNRLSDVWINPNNLIPVDGKGFIYSESNH